MKKIFVALMMIAMLQGVTYGDEDGVGKTKFEKIKENLLENIWKMQNHLHDFESCIKSANSGNDMKSCRKENEKKMEAIHSERKRMKATPEELKEKNPYINEELQLEPVDIKEKNLYINKEFQPVPDDIKEKDLYINEEIQLIPDDIKEPSQHISGEVQLAPGNIKEKGQHISEEIQLVPDDIKEPSQHISGN